MHYASSTSQSPRHVAHSRLVKPGTATGKVARMSRTFHPVNLEEFERRLPHAVRDVGFFGNGVKKVTSTLASEVPIREHVFLIPHWKGSPFDVLCYSSILIATGLMRDVDDDAVRFVLRLHCADGVIIHRSMGKCIRIRTLFANIEKKLAEANRLIRTRANMDDHFPVITSLQGVK